MPVPDPQPVPAETRPKRRWKKWLWIFPVLLISGLVWLNGPGLRWLGPRVAFRYLEKAGLRGDFRIEGSFTGGLAIADLQLVGDGDIEKLTVRRAAVDYRLGGLRKGEIDGIRIDGVHAQLRLGLEKKDEPEPEKKPLDLEELVTTLRKVRGQVIPIGIDLKDLSLSATREGRPVLALAPTAISHGRGSDAFTIDLGAITDETGRVWPARKSTILWTADQLTLDRIDPFPDTSVRDVVIQLPATGGPSVDARLHLDEAIFVLTSSPGLTDARFDLREGSLQLDQTLKKFGVEIPATAKLTSVAIGLENIFPDPAAATGTAQILLESIESAGWSVPELSLDATLESGGAAFAARGMTLGTAVSLNASAPLVREKGAFDLGETTGTFNIADVPALVAELAKRAPAIDPAAPVPASSFDGKFAVSFKANQPTAASADVLLKPQDEKLASAIAIAGRWQPDSPVIADVSADGLKLAARYDIAAATYQGTLALDSFTNARIDRWLAVAKVKAGGTVVLSGNWSGRGEIKTGRHLGELALANAAWQQEEMPPVAASGNVTYDWPGGFQTRDLKVERENQSITLDAGLAGGLLEMRRFQWSETGKEIAAGTASLPVPEDFSKWRETLANDKRPVAISVDSSVLSLALLEPWLPAAKEIDPRSTGQLRVKVAGSYAAPQIDILLEAKDLRSPAQPGLPPADLRIEIAGRDQNLTVDGMATAPDFPPAVLKAAMAFRPAEWAETPESIKNEPINARVDLPRLDLSRFASLVPTAKELTGIVTGNVTVTGKAGDPVLQGALDVTNAGVVFTNPELPDVKGVSAAFDLNFDRILVKNLRANIAGGTATGEGSLLLEGGKPGPIDFRLRANHLPLVRDEQMIIRANADIRLAGTMENAAITGTVGAVDSLFYRDIELLPIGKPFSGPAAAELPKIDAPRTPGSSMPEPFRNWRLDVVVKTEEPFLIRGNLGTGEVDMAMRIGGTLGSPAPDGAVRIRDASAALPFSTLRVGRGTLRFTPDTGFDPILEIRGQAEPRPYRVDIYVYGRLSDPQIILTSSPPLPENEIMTLLATGTTTSGLEDPQAASSRAFQLLIEEARRGRLGFSRQLRPVLKLLDRVDFNLAESDPYSSDSYSTATISITDRWFLTAGMGTEGNSRVLAIWRLSLR